MIPGWRFPDEIALPDPLDAEAALATLTEPRYFAGWGAALRCLTGVEWSLLHAGGPPFWFAVLPLQRGVSAVVSVSRRRARAHRIDVGGVPDPEVSVPVAEFVGYLQRNLAAARDR